MGIEGGSLQARLDRWARRLQNLTVSPLTRDYPESALSDVAKRAIEAFEGLRLSPDVKLAVEKLRQTGDSNFLVFLTAFVVLVSRLTGDEDIALGTSSEIDGRPFLLRVPVSQSESFVELHARVVKVCITCIVSVILTLARHSQKEPRILFP